MFPSNGLSVARRFEPRRGRAFRNHHVDLSLNQFPLKLCCENLNVYAKILEPLQRLICESWANILSPNPTVGYCFKRKLFTPKNCIAREKIGHASADTATLAHIVDVDLHRIVRLGGL